MRSGHAIRAADAVAVACLVLLTAGCRGTADVDAPSTTARPSCPHGIGRNVTGHRGAQRILVHLPACYDRDPARRYPVVVLLHGSGADERQWVDIGTTTEADRLTRRGAIAPAILVMPDEGDASSADQADNVIGQVLPWVDATYRTIPLPADRAISGISRGGAAALRVAMARPDLFGVVAAHSPTIPGDPATIAAGLRPLSGRIWLDSGTQDRFAPDVERLADALRRDGTRAEVRRPTGGHDRPYWRRNVAAYLVFDAARWR